MKLVINMIHVQRSVDTLDFLVLNMPEFMHLWNFLQLYIICRQFYSIFTYIMELRINQKFKSSTDLQLKNIKYYVKLLCKIF